MNVFSGFDGISCGRVALERIGITPDFYHASEIDKNAILIAQKNYPGTIQLGSITEVKAEQLGRLDLIIGGSPCQGFSFAGAGLNFDDPRSKLFFEFDRILAEARIINPKVKFLLENVKMSEQSENIITKRLGVRPIRLNSDLVTAQSRQRLYWTNIIVNSIPKDLKISLKDILIDNCVTDRTKSYCIDANYGKGSNPRSYAMGRRQIVFYDKSDMIFFLKHGKSTKTKDVKFRILTPEECEVLQTLPPGYTEGIAKVNRYHGIGNGWTIDIIAHLLKNIIY